MTLQEAPVPYVSCPAAVINTRVDVAWALLIKPAAWACSMCALAASIRPDLRSSDKRSAARLARLLHLKLTFRMIEIDPYQHRLCLDVHLPFGITVHGDLSCMPLDVDDCRVDYCCNFDFPSGWRGSLAKVLIHHGFESGPEDSLSHLKHAAERDAARGSGELRYED